MKTPATPRPAGPGSRQPILKLPATMPNGARFKSHPLLHFVKTRMPEGANKTTLARHMGVAPQSLYRWERLCEADRNFPLPVARAVQIASFFDIPVSMLRPDIFPKTKEVKA